MRASRRWNRLRRRIDSASSEDRETEIRRVIADRRRILIMLLEGHHFEEAKGFIKEAQKRLGIDLREDYRQWLRGEVAGILALDRKIHRDANRLKAQPIWPPFIEYEREFDEEEKSSSRDELAMVYMELAAVYSRLMPREPLSGRHAS